MGAPLRRRPVPIGGSKLAFVSFSTFCCVKFAGSKSKKRAADEAGGAAAEAPAAKRRGRPPGTLNKPRPHNPPPRVLKE